MRLIRYQPEHQKLMLALHRSAVEEFTLSMSQQQDEADLVAIDEVYLHSRGEFLLGFIGERLVAMGGFKRLSDVVAELRKFDGVWDSMRTPQQMRLVNLVVERVGYDGRTRKVTVAFRSQGMRGLCSGRRIE